ncbi:hypothetical protein MRY87_06000 [bacterium]|nr:hypothetical protein [bacterium]
MFIRGTVSFCIAAACITGAGCESSTAKETEELTERQEDDSSYTTHYGKSVGKAKALTTDSHERNEEIASQADEIFSE